MGLKLEAGPVPVESLTVHQLGVLCNGCGPQFLPRWLVPDGIYGPACNQHDADYHAGGTDEHRSAADLRFRANMQACRQAADLGILRRFFWYWAALYFLAVKAIGGQAFHYRESPETDPQRLVAEATGASTDTDTMGS